MSSSSNSYPVSGNYNYITPVPSSLRPLISFSTRLPSKTTKFLVNNNPLISNMVIDQAPRLPRESELLDDNSNCDSDSVSNTISYSSRLLVSFHGSPRSLPLLPRGCRHHPRHHHHNYYRGHRSTSVGSSVQRVLFPQNDDIDDDANEVK